MPANGPRSAGELCPGPVEESGKVRRYGLDAGVGIRASAVVLHDERPGRGGLEAGEGPEPIKVRDISVGGGQLGR